MYMEIYVMLKKLKELLKNMDLKVIYDAAHAFGETYKGKGIATFGDASMFSFHATKVFNTIEGGAVCFHDHEFGKKFIRLKNFGIRTGTVWMVLVLMQK